MRGFNRALTTVENVLAAGALGAAAAITITAVVLRKVFDIFLFWSEEATIYLIIYSTFLGAVITLREHEHVNVDVIAAFLGRRGKQVMALIAIVVTLVYLAVVGFFAWMLLFEPFSTSTSTPAMRLPLWVVEISVALGFTLMFLRGMEILVRTIRSGAEEPHDLETEAASLGLDIHDLEREKDKLMGRRDENDGRSDS
jgi:C4-dicarboxylate transporter DctQ subunit